MSAYDVWKLAGPAVNEGGNDAADPDCDECGGSGWSCDDYWKDSGPCGCIERRREAWDETLRDLSDAVLDVVNLADERAIKGNWLDFRVEHAGDPLLVLMDLFGDLAEVEA